MKFHTKMILRSKQISSVYNAQDPHSFCCDHYYIRELLFRAMYRCHNVRIFLNNLPIYRAGIYSLQLYTQLKKRKNIGEVFFYRITNIFSDNHALEKWAQYFRTYKKLLQSDFIIQSHIPRETLQIYDY